MIVEALSSFILVIVATTVSAQYVDTELGPLLVSIAGGSAAVTCAYIFRHVTPAGSHGNPAITFAAVIFHDRFQFDR